jgi:SnoaL-like domain
MGLSYSEEEQQRFFDKLAIREVLDEYWFGLGREDYDSVVGAFTTDATYASLSGHQAIRSAVERASGNRCTNILCGSQRIEIDGDTARADTQAVAFLVPHGHDPERLIIQGIRYIDHLVRTPEGWRIKRRSGLENRTGAHDTPLEFEIAVNPIKLADVLAGDG